MAWCWILCALLFLSALYGFLTAPRRGGRARDMEKLYAHRGLHGDGASENGMEAFRRACARGLGIELDVRFTKDRVLVVFHDDTLGRVCGDTRRVDELPLSELRERRLPDGGGIPTLDEVLELVDGRVPLLVEIKHGPDIGRLSRAVYERMRAYRGAYVVESFNPLCVRWFKKHAPEVVRGQLVQARAEYRGTVAAPAGFFMAALLTNALARPDFVAYSVERMHDATIRMHRRVFRTPLAVWTVRSRKDLRGILARGESAIFEAGAGEDPIQTEDLP